MRNGGKARGRRWECTLPTLDTASLHVKMCRWLTSYVPPLSISSIVVSLWLACCLAKSTLIGWREYYGGGGVGVDRLLCGAQQTRGFYPMLFQYWPTANGAGPTLKTTLGQVFVFAGRAVRILIHACRLCLVGTGCTVLCVVGMVMSIKKPVGWKNYLSRFDCIWCALTLRCLLNQTTSQIWISVRRL